MLANPFTLPEDSHSLVKPKRSLDRETFLLLVAMCLGVVLTLFVVMFNLTPQFSTPQTSKGSEPSSPAVTSPSDTLSPDHVPLATGNEPIDTLFIQSGCAACHTIPGIDAAKGREGPILVLGTTARQRLADPSYHGRATTEWEYVQESILDPGAYVVPGYPDRVMPRWYGQKLSATALEKIVSYLLTVQDPSASTDAPPSPRS
ncbi:MAG: hypothetical protein D6704_11000 [Nitrospirae bacterium]|nr:MAG: hypothetical protein D6704_11000 [Nitrospirota bacterium]